MVVRRHVDRPHATSGTDEMWRIPVHRSAAQWSALQLEVEAIAYAGRVPVARIRYEDLMADPVRTLVAATATLDVPLGPGDLPWPAARWSCSPATDCPATPGDSVQGACR